MKTISMFIALINSLVAGLLISFLVTSADFQISMKWWSIARISIALVVIVIGVITWIGSMVPIRPGPLVLGSLFLVATGPATVVWTFHRASLTGDMEYHMVLYGCSLFVQGITLLFSTSQGQENTSIA